VEEIHHCWTVHKYLFPFHPEDNSRFCTSACLKCDQRTWTCPFHRRTSQSLPACTVWREHWSHHCQRQYRCLYLFHRFCTISYREARQHPSETDIYPRRNLHDSLDPHKSCDNQMTLK
jgi:hypothetical protein